MESLALASWNNAAGSRVVSGCLVAGLCVVKKWWVALCSKGSLSLRKG